MIPIVYEAVIGGADSAIKGVARIVRVGMGGMLELGCRRSHDRRQVETRIWSPTGAQDNIAHYELKDKSTDQASPRIAHTLIVPMLILNKPKLIPFANDYSSAPFISTALKAMDFA